VATVKRATFSVAYPPELTHPMHRAVSGDGEITRAELLTWGPTTEVTTLSWYDGGESPVGALLDGLDSVTERSLHPGDGGTYAFVRQREYEFADPVMALVARARVAFLPPITFRESGAVRFVVVGASGEVSAFHDDLSELGDVTIRSVHDFSRRQSSATLTERQRAALRAAVAVGYYEVPRAGSVGDVAAELGCARSTAGELLRKAESAVVEGFVAVER
jgi:hypothetical protein